MRNVHDEPYIAFVSRLRSARKRQGKTQSELANLLKKPQSYVSKVETCERRIDVIEAARWCLALEIKLMDIIPTDLQTIENIL